MLKFYYTCENVQKCTTHKWRHSFHMFSFVLCFLPTSGNVCLHMWIAHLCTFSHVDQNVHISSCFLFCFYEAKFWSTCENVQKCAVHMWRQISHDFICPLFISTCRTVYLHARMCADVQFTGEDIHFKPFHVFSVLFPHVNILIHMSTSVFRNVLLFWRLDWKNKRQVEEEVITTSGNFQYENCHYLDYFLD